MGSTSLTLLFLPSVSSQTQVRSVYLLRGKVVRAFSAIRCEPVYFRGAIAAWQWLGSSSGDSRIGRIKKLMVHTAAALDFFLTALWSGNEIPHHCCFPMLLPHCTKRISSFVFSMFLIFFLRPPLRLLHNMDSFKAQHLLLLVVCFAFCLFVFT